MISYVEWSKEYDAFKKVVKPILTKDLPTEPGELSAENQALPKLLDAAREHASMGAYFYRDFREKKQSMAQVTWSQKNSEGLADSIKSRMIAVSVAMRPQA